MADTGKPESFIVRFLRPDGRGSAGVGVLVGPRQVVTCAHVVNAALGLDQRQQGKPESPVRIDFPFLDGDSPDGGLPGSGSPEGGFPGGAARNERKARVDVWRPPPEADGAPGADIAGLVIEGGPPGGAVPCRTRRRPPRHGTAVRVCGFTPERPDGSWVHAVVRGTIAHRRVQLDSTPGSALRVRPGFSGGPVIEDSSGRVAGIITASGTVSNDSYAIGADVLREAWPGVLKPPAGYLPLLAGGVTAVTTAAVLSFLIAGPPRPAALPSAIVLGSPPGGVAVDPGTHTAYVTTPGNNNTLSLISTETGKVTDAVAVGEQPQAVAVDPATHTAYTANTREDTVSVIDTVSRQVTGAIPVGGTPDALAIDPVTRNVYAANYAENSVSVINPAVNPVAPIATVPVGTHPTAVTVSPTAHTAYVANNDDQSISVISTGTNKVIRTLHPDSKPYAVAIDPDTRTAYLAVVGSDSLLVLNTGTGAPTRSITVGEGPAALAIDLAAHTLYVANSTENTVSVISTDTNTVTRTVPVGTDPRSVAVDPVTHIAYVTCVTGDKVSIIRPGR